MYDVQLHFTFISCNFENSFWKFVTACRISYGHFQTVSNNLMHFYFINGYNISIHCASYLNFDRIVSYYSYLCIYHFFL